MTECKSTPLAIKVLIGRASLDIQQACHDHVHDEIQRRAIQGFIQGRLSVLVFEINEGAQLEYPE